MLKLGRPPFKETRWVVTSFKLTCYIQVGSFTFQRDTLGCHLVQSDMLSSNWVIRLQRDVLGCHLIKSDMLFTSLSFQRGTLPSLCNFSSNIEGISPNQITNSVEALSAGKQLDLAKKCFLP
ncbi:hypothetical protein AABB24_002665 [Solanum stoloniferum]|uniref:Uncharacterized protein n=1 Tax=Solanum stoloniferum TaxID=62892 RepID=A0ABD2V7V0_9SOLN